MCKLYVIGLLYNIYATLRLRLAIEASVTFPLLQNNSGVFYDPIFYSTYDLK